MKTILTIVLGLILQSCDFVSRNTTDNRIKTIDFGAFSLDVPSNWESYKVKGIDSYVGGLTNGLDTLTFDYGWYSYDLGYEDPQTQLFSLDTINGKIAILTKPLHSKGLVGLYISNATKDNHFNLLCRQPQNFDEVLEILKSVKFVDSDTSLNSQFFEFDSRDIVTTASNYFHKSCLVCHTTSHDGALTGPSLRDYPRHKFIDWFTSDTSLVSSSPMNKAWHQRALKIQGLELKILTDYLTKD